MPEQNKKNEFELTETMWGYVSELEAPIEADEAQENYEEYQKSYKKGKEVGNKLQYEVTLRVKNFKEFTASSGRKAPMTGWVSCKNLYGEKLDIYNGEYGLYWVDPETNERRISYKFDFKDKNGIEYNFFGYKVIVHDRPGLDILEDSTTLFASISKFENGRKIIVAQGIIHYHVEGFPAMVFSIKTPKDDNMINRLRMTLKFFSFVNKELSEYFKEVNPFYQADYNHLVCKGISTTSGRENEFFLLSGAHDKGFPWGDNVGFWDIALLLKDGDSWRRFALTNYTIPNLTLRITDGTCKFEGKMFEITIGHQVNFSEMHQDELPEYLREVEAKIEVSFKQKLVETRNIPFEANIEKIKSSNKKAWKKIKKSKFYKELKKWKRDFPGPGYTTNIYRIEEIKGNFVVDGVNYSIQKDKSLGEGEFASLAGMRKPALYFNYFCAIEPEADLFRIHIRSGILRSLTNNILSIKTEELMGEVIGQLSRMDLKIQGTQKEDIEPEVAASLMIPQEDLLEINNDQYPTKTFQRRIVVLPGYDGGRTLALEEDMSVLNLESVNSDKIATVAAIKDPDRFKALDKVLDATNFFALLDKAQENSGKTKEDFSIIVKPNFSFMYSLNDITSFTDPDLVELLIDRIYEKGYRNIAVAEAHSTYTVYFTNRDIPTLAKYIGLRGKNYRIIDLSESIVSYDFGRTLGMHEVHPEWQNADFRISFAKNKTHSYSFYTLTIKNIYGALPRKNKFKEYHCNKELGIFDSTIDFIEEFPIHFGLIDGYFSADGAFGIFADTEPNCTQTIIGGDDIVAVDWIGASKMGLDPMISEYMQLAVERFGKPKIKMTGNHSIYPQWRNVPEIISKAAFDFMDRNYTMGNFLYSIMGTMDPFFTFTPGEVSRRIVRLFTPPIRKMLFQWVEGEREELSWNQFQKLFDPEQVKYMEKLIKSLFE